MKKPFYIAILVPTSLNTDCFIEELKQGKLKILFPKSINLNLEIHSKSEINKFVDLEERLSIKKINTTSQSLKTMSSSEQRKLLLNYLLQINTDILLIDNLLDSLDIATQKSLTPILTKAAQRFSIIQLITRANDIFPFINQFYFYNEKTLRTFNTKKKLKEFQQSETTKLFEYPLPQPKKEITIKGDELIFFKNCSVSFLKKSFKFYCLAN